MQNLRTQLLHELYADIEANRLLLPSLPEVALRIRDLAADPDCSAEELEQVIAQDTAIAARLLKVANSAVLARHNPVVTLQQAIRNLGLNLVQSLVTQLAILQTLRDCGEPQRMRGFIAGSLHISAQCHSLASLHNHLDPELATLGGLLHDVGKLPLRSALAQRSDLSEAQRFELEMALHPQVGAFMLHRWGMPDELVAMARFHERILRDSERTRPDYPDLVIAASLLHYGVERGRYAEYAGLTIPALARVTQSLDPLLHRQSAGQRMALAQVLASA